MYYAVARTDRPRGGFDPARLEEPSRPGAVVPKIVEAPFTTAAKGFTEVKIVGVHDRAPTERVVIREGLDIRQERRRHDRDELPPGRFLVGNHAQQAVGDLFQQFVAGLVAERVVHLLEPVEVDQHQRARTLLCDKGAERCLQRLADPCAVRKAGERIVHRQP